MAAQEEFEARVVSFPVAGQDRAPYERQPKETTRAFEAFSIYRDMGPARSISKVAQECTKSRALLRRWSARWEWVQRAAAWDKEQDRVRRDKLLEEIEEMCKRHAAMSVGFEAKLMTALQSINPEDLTPMEMIRWFEVAVKVEWLARGVSTERVSLNRQVGMENDAEFARRIIEDPGGAELACDLIARLARPDTANTASYKGDRPVASSG